MSLPSPTEIFVRAYTEKPGEAPLAAKIGSRRNDKPSPWSLTFDCETTVDAAQALRIGVYQVRYDGELRDEGLFYEPTDLAVDEMETIQRFATANQLTMLTADEFRTEVFLKVGYHRSGLIIGFNLPFDISRIATGHGPARDKFRGGFSFAVTRWKSDPRVRVKHLSARAALIEFAKPGKQDMARSERKREGPQRPPNRGYFVDVKTLAAALRSRTYTLATLAEYLKTPTQKLETDEHGGPITPEYLDYARADVQATWEAYVALKKRYDDHGLKTGVHRILSEASIGKAYFKEMGIKPFLANQPDFPREVFGKIMCSYYGGRAEVRIRRKPTQVLYCDFKSMYPTVSALMGLWSFVTADGVRMGDSTRETQGFLDAVSLKDMQSPSSWKRLTTLVRLRPNDDALPVRATYDGNVNTIGLNHITSEQPLWYTLADCVASKLLTGKTPVIDEAMTFRPGPPQKGMTGINLFGIPEYAVDPNSDDVFTRLIDLRGEAKARGDPLQLAMKIIANATSYGIFIEVLRDDAPKPELLDVYGPDGTKQTISSTAIEEPGRYFHPLLGTLITGAARLMLALAERVAEDQGLGWVFCDTDSIAMAKPESMGQAAFLQRGQAVVDWFTGLNPYRQKGSILEIEDANYAVGTKTHEPLYCLALSAKRYALFNLKADGKPILRKASAHGLGHLLAPYGANNLPDGLEVPEFGENFTGVKLWQHHLWERIIAAALGTTPNVVPLDYHPSLQSPAMSRYGATSPRLLDWMKTWNADKPYQRQVRPFGFLLSYFPRAGPWADLPEPQEVDPHQRGRPKKDHKPKPVSPFETDHQVAVEQAFCRETGAHVPVDELKTYAEALAQFHLSTEDKFENGDFADDGLTRRRHVQVESVGMIGKEANKVGESGASDPGSPSRVEFALHETTPVLQNGRTKLNSG